MFTITTRGMGRWHADVSAGTVTFGYTPDDAVPNTSYHLPRVWPGRGLAIPAAAVEAFRAALAEVMQRPAYWQARTPGHDSAELWSFPWLDPDEEFVFITGPCESVDATVGYRPTRAFTIALADVRGLRIRVNAYLDGIRPKAGSGITPGG
ncbi:hypothetical protein [Amycolatopsis sp. NPDC049868]|uniref:hypothetical protein n=1 Tax=Amycolatopsis sp. NPDC049868 TaxID=3363934 RepID=UPI0037B6A2AE